MKFLWSKLSLGGLYTDADADADDTDADDTDDNDNDNDTWWTEHDCIGSLPNEPKNLRKFDNITEAWKIFTGWAYSI